MSIRQPAASLPLLSVVAPRASERALLRLSWMRIMRGSRVMPLAAAAVTTRSKAFWTQVTKASICPASGRVGSAGGLVVGMLGNWAMRDFWMEEAERVLAMAGQ